MSRMSVTVDDELLEEAREVLGAETRAEAIRAALEQVVRRWRLEQALTHRGAIELLGNQAELSRLRAGE